MIYSELKYRLLKVYVNLWIFCFSILFWQIVLIAIESTSHLINFLNAVSSACNPTFKKLQIANLQIKSKDYKMLLLNAVDTFTANKTVCY